MNALQLSREDVCITLDERLQSWMAKYSSEPYLLSMAESIVRQIFPNLPRPFSAVELYGVPQDERVYVKMWHQGSERQEVWRLQFTHGAEPVMDRV